MVEILIVTIVGYAVVYFTYLKLENWLFLGSTIIIIQLEKGVILTSFFLDFNNCIFFNIRVSVFVILKYKK